MVVRPGANRKAEVQRPGQSSTKFRSDAKNWFIFILHLEKILELHTCFYNDFTCFFLLEISIYIHVWFVLCILFIHENTSAFDNCFLFRAAYLIFTMSFYKADRITLLMHMLSFCRLKKPISKPTQTGNGALETERSRVPLRTS